MARTLIGYGITNNQGIAKLDHDANDQSIEGYVGEGTGSINIKAECGSLLSKTYDVIDCTSIDYATSSAHLDSMWSSVTYFTRGDEYSTLTNTSQVLMYTVITDNTGVVCDIMLDTTENDAFITVRNGSTTKKGLARSDLNLSNNVWYRLKIEIKDSKVVFSVGSDSTTSFTLDEFNRLYFRTGANETMKLKNIGKYSI